MTVAEVFQEISAADFFYRNRDIAGFTSPSRAVYSTIRELVENSLDACETMGVPPDIYLRLSHESGPVDGPGVYSVRVEDNGLGIPGKIIPSAFGQVLYGSKYKLRQTRGQFGLGGKMALLYGQVTTHSEAQIVSSTGPKDRVTEVILRIDIQQNKPIIMKNKTHPNKHHWRGTAIEFKTEADYSRAMSKILDYMKQTAIIVPYANITFVDPRGRLYRFLRGKTTVPEAPTETSPHPHGVDVETVQRLLKVTNAKTLQEFLRKHFQRIGDATARKFLQYASMGQRKTPRNMTPDDVVKLVNAMKNYEDFLAPDSSCLSPLGEDLLATGIKKELGITDDDIAQGHAYVGTLQRKPATYAGFPFIVEVGLASSKNIPTEGKILLFRFANKIPLLFDEASDVSWKVVNNTIDWRNYKVAPGETPLAVFVHLCSTKVPYKTVGKEFIADRPDVEHEIVNAIREAGRTLKLYLSKKEHLATERKRLDVFEKYLPKIAQFSTKLAKQKREPEVSTLLKSVMKYGPANEEEQEQE
ncbi:MAG: DNA topoisomerase VI subunit B [Crenarchaeota archaeon 13_1_40CM_3_53_5]|nr:MAG: DNA topoisomerase VI subunit B [Crenarchaeota archaeon 13_1_40CM_3_53_5]